MAKQYLETAVGPISCFYLAVAIIVQGYEIGYAVIKNLIFTIRPASQK